MKKTTKFLLMIMGSGALLLTGCSIANYDYSGTPFRNHVVDGKEYRVYDQPENSRMMLTLSSADKTTGGFGMEFRLNLFEPEPSNESWIVAGQDFLNSYGRGNCKVTDASVLLPPQWEVTYECK